MPLLEKQMPVWRMAFRVALSFLLGWSHVKTKWFQAPQIWMKNEDLVWKSVIRSKSNIILVYICKLYR